MENNSKKCEVMYVNYNIRNPKVRVIDEATRRQKVMDTHVAIALAQENHLDLV